MNRFVGKALVKVISESGRSFLGIFRRMRLGLIWEFEGSVRVDGKIYVRSYGGAVRIGHKTRLGPYVNISCASGATLTVGRRTSINFGSFIEAIEEVTIGDDVLIGEYCSIRDNDHQWTNPDVSISEQGFVSKPVVIEDGVWLGRSVVVGKGVRIGRGAIVGANAVVTHDVPPNAVVGGVPARLLKWRGQL